MARPKNPIVVILSMLIVGALVCVIARFSYAAYVIVQSGESMGAVPPKSLLIDVMGLHRFALYGAGGGALFGVVLVIVDLLRSGGRGEDSTWKTREDIEPFAGDEVKARRMEIGDQYLKERDLDQGDDGRG